MDANQDRNEQHQSPQPRGRRRRWMLGFVAVPMIVFVAVAGYVLFGPTQFEQEISALRAQGLPTNAVELNAYYSVPSGVTDTTELWTAAIRNARIDQRAKTIPIIGTGSTAIPNPGQEWAELEASRAFLEEMNEEMRLIWKAAEAGGMARYPIDFRNGINVRLPHAQEARTLVRLLTLSAHVNAHEGKIHAVLNDVAGIFAVSDSLRGEPNLISQLVRIGNYGAGCELAANMLPFCNWTDEELATLQLTIGGAEFRAEMLRALHGERAISFHTLDTTVGFMFRGTNKSKSLELFGDTTEGLDSSWQEATRRCETLEKQMKVNTGNVISRLRYMSVWTPMLLLPALRQAVSAGTRAEARQNCMIATIAAYRYRLQNGELPTSLGELKDFIAGDDATTNQRLTDPFDGQPLRFKSDSGNLVIYSISENRLDDGGVISNEKPQEGDLGYSIQQ